MAAEDLLTNKNRAGIGHVTKTYFCNLQCVSSPPNTMSRIPINGVSLDVIYHKDFIGMLGSIIHGFSSISSPLLCRGRIWDMSLFVISKKALSFVWNILEKVIQDVKLMF